MLFASHQPLRVCLHVRACVHVCVCVCACVCVHVHVCEYVIGLRHRNGAEVLWRFLLSISSLVYLLLEFLLPFTVAILSLK